MNINFHLIISIYYSNYSIIQSKCDMKILLASHLCNNITKVLEQFYFLCKTLQGEEFYMYLYSTITKSTMWKVLQEKLSKTCKKWKYL